MLPYQLRKFFGWFLLSENIQGKDIWTKFKHFFTDDFLGDKDNNALFQISKIFKHEGMTCTDFGLPEPDMNFIDDKCEITESDLISFKNLFNNLYIQLNKDQKYIFDNLSNNSNKIHFIDGPGGSGKTFLYKAIIYYFLSQKKKILSMAWTGIASILLPKGMTSHKTFRLPLDLTNIETSFFKLDSDKKKLREADIIIWDEASMIPKKALEIVNKTLQDLCNNNLFFGGKLIVLGGDFRQILPVIRNGNRNLIIEETIKYSFLWPFFQIWKLKENVRCQNKEFNLKLLQIGEGTINPFIIPNSWKTNDICSKIFENINNESCNNSVILTSHNEDMNILNKRILKLLDGEVKSYYSIDYATHKGVDQTDDNIQLNYPIDVLNNIKEGLPPHQLDLKVNAIVMLIRNLSISDGLCNGTRLKITKLFTHNIEAEIITGEKFGCKVFIPRITLNTGNNSYLPFTLYRKQFPLVLAFAMTINKSQGQSFDKVGIYLSRHLFSHGQLYVALSRCKNSNNIFIQNILDDSSKINNIVWDEIFN